MKKKKKLFSEIPVLKGERVTLRALTPDDSDGLRELTQCDPVYRYLPAVLFEKKYDDAGYVIDRLYDECIKQSLILGVFWEDSFCGLAEIYGYDAELRKASVGNRFLPRFWGQGIASETLDLMIDYIFDETDVVMITATSMHANKASAKVLKKHGFMLVAREVLADWGFPEPTVTDKWMKTGEDHRCQ